ncbi:MAG TPA: outer membrane beta-barrel protein [Telluria sp.]|jgi:opacity protein-like surface antigen
MLKKIAIAAALAALSSAAMAADQPYFYAGGDLGRTDFKFAPSATSYGAFAGYQINQTFGIEAGYRRLAHTSEFDFNANVTQVSLSATATLPLEGGFSVYGRLGMSGARVRYSGPGWISHHNDNSALYGVGFNYAITPAVSARIEVQRAARDTTNLSTGISYRF